MLTFCYELCNTVEVNPSVKTMAKSKATHKGECQICGTVQKLPNGKLANHGYTVQWSKFQGTCPGSLELPYEQSCDLLKDRLPHVKREVEEMSAYYESLLQPATEPCSHVKVYLSELRLYDWYKACLTVVKQRNEASGYEWHEIHATYQSKGKNKTEKLDLDYVLKSLSLLEIATVLNKQYATEYYKEINYTLSYLKWVQDRITNWQLKNSN